MTSSEINLCVRRVIRLALPAFVVLLVLPATARADIVSEWNERASATMDTERQGGVAQARAFAMMHRAMFDAVASAPSPGASPEAAAGAAARAVLAELFPKHKPAFDAALEAALAKVPDGAPKSTGISTGEKAAAAILAERKADGINAPDTYRPLTTPGTYIVTAMPVISHVAGIKPFALQGVSQFRPGPPPGLDSASLRRCIRSIHAHTAWSMVPRVS